MAFGWILRLWKGGRETVQLGDQVRELSSLASEGWKAAICPRIALVAEYRLLEAKLFNATDEGERLELSQRRNQLAERIQTEALEKKMVQLEGQTASQADLARLAKSLQEVSECAGQDIDALREQVAESEKRREQDEQRFRGNIIILEQRNEKLEAENEMRKTELTQLKRVSSQRDEQLRLEVEKVRQEEQALRTENKNLRSEIAQLRQVGSDRDQRLRRLIYAVVLTLGPAVLFAIFRQ